MPKLQGYGFDPPPKLGRFRVRYWQVERDGYVHQFIYSTTPIEHDGRKFFVAEYWRFPGERRPRGKPLRKQRKFVQRWRAKDCAYKWLCELVGRPFRSFHRDVQKARDTAYVIVPDDRSIGFLGWTMHRGGLSGVRVSVDGTYGHLMAVQGGVVPDEAKEAGFLASGAGEFKMMLWKDRTKRAVDRRLEDV